MADDFLDPVKVDEFLRSEGYRPFGDFIEKGVKIVLWSHPNKPDRTVIHYGKAIMIFDRNFDLEKELLIQQVKTTRPMLKLI